jgi:4-hydroxy-tetrahydrodipicolinate synthase
MGTENVREPRLPLAGAERKKVLAIIDQAIKDRPLLPDYQNL